MTISKSPERHTFQRDGYIRRQAENNEPVSTSHMKMFDDLKEQEDHKFDEPESRENSMEYDLRTTKWILDKVRDDDVYAQNLYAVMCNNDFMKADVWPILKKEKWSCSWRYAGGIIADMQQKGDYIDWYCSGIRNDISEEEIAKFNDDQMAFYKQTLAYVSEGFVTDEIREDLLKLGWIVLDEDNSSLAI